MTDRVTVALDVDSLFAVDAILRTLAGRVRRYKISPQLINVVGLENPVRIIRNHGAEAFYDGSFLDTPDAVERLALQALESGVTAFSVQISGGREVMRVAKDAVTQYVSRSGSTVTSRPRIYGLTLLTSLGYDDLVDLGVFPDYEHPDAKVEARIRQERITRFVVRWARFAQNFGLDGVIASPREAAAIRTACEPSFRIVAPSIRPDGFDLDDQDRWATPTFAVRVGVDELIIGRPITNPPFYIGGPPNALRLVEIEIQQALGELAPFPIR